MAAELATSLAMSEADRLEQAEALVRGYCGWHIAPVRTQTVVLSGDFSSVLILPSLHVVTITSIKLNDVALDVDSFDWSTAGVVTSRVGPWCARKVEVQFTHGHAAPPVEVSAIVQAVAQRAVDNPGSRPRAQAGPFADSFSTVGANQAPALALLDAEKSTLDRSYRLPPRP